MNAILNFIAAIGAAALNALGLLGELGVFAVTGLSHIFRPPFYPRQFGRSDGRKNNLKGVGHKIGGA